MRSAPATALATEVAALRRRVAEQDELLDAIRRGEVDALVVQGAAGREVYTLSSADEAFRSLVDAAGDGALMLDAGGVVLYANAAVARLLRASRDKVVGTRLAQWLVEGAGAELVAAMLSAGPGDTVRIETTLRSAAGASGPLVVARLTATRASSRGPIASSVIVTDLTTLKDQQAVLERRVAERTAALEEAQWEMRRQEKFAALGTFVAGVAHEISNPLTYMTMAAELLDADLRGRARGSKLAAADASALADAADNAERVLRGCHRIQYIVNALQRIARPGGARVLVKLDDVVRENLPSPPASLRLVTDLQSRAWVRVAISDLHDVVLVLVQNAFEATASLGGDVVVATRDAGDVARIVVTDHGVGIPPSQQASIFTPFFTTKDTGVGLHLTIAKHLVEEHGGRIEFASTPGEGTTFTVELPVAPPPDAPPVGAN